MLCVPTGVARRAVADARRLVRLDDLLHIGGDALMRWGGRIFFPLLLAAAGGAVAPHIGLPGLTVPEAIFLPLALSGGLIFAGASAKYIPWLFQGARLAVAEAQDLNLMSDYKKARAPVYLDRLWQTVYRYEAPRESIAAAADWDVVVHSTETNKQRFMEVATAALARPIPQMRQRNEIGYDLSLLEDVLDGAPCHQSDNKAIQQYRGNSVLRTAQELLAEARIEHAPVMPYLGLSQYLWYGLVMREIAYQTGSSLARLRRQFPDERVTAQTLLWPGSERHLPAPAVKVAVLTERERILCRVFGPDIHSADHMLQRMYLPDFVRATALRLRFDAQYCTGSLGYTVHDDLQAIGVNAQLNPAYQKFLDVAMHRLLAFRSMLQEKRTDVAGHGQWLRAAKTAFHINYNNLQHDWRALPARMHRTIDVLGQHLPLWTERLLTVRVHQQLTVIEFKEQRWLLEQLYDSLHQQAGAAAAETPEVAAG